MPLCVCVCVFVCVCVCVCVFCVERYLLLTKTDIMVDLGQNDGADDPGQPDWNLEQHQDENVRSLSVIILDVFRLDCHGADKEHEEEDVEERKNVIDCPEAAVFLDV